MDAEQFRSAHKLRPFRPITIKTSSGEDYQVNHPEAMWQSPQGGTVIFATGGESFAMLATELVTAFVFSEAQSSEK
jgi:hypothetical protein